MRLSLIFFVLSARLFSFLLMKSRFIKCYTWIFIIVIVANATTIFNWNPQLAWVLVIIIKSNQDTERKNKNYKLYSSEIRYDYFSSLLCGSKYSTVCGFELSFHFHIQVFRCACVFFAWTKRQFELMFQQNIRFLFPECAFLNIQYLPFYRIWSF